MREFTGLASFRRFLEEEAITEPERLLVAAGASVMVMEKSIKDTFGDDTKLAPISQDSTAQLRSDGGAGGPLYIDGKLLRDSIESMHAQMGDGAVGGVGSSEPVMVYQEHGFTTASNSMIPDKIVPPRPAFAIGVYEALPLVKQIIDAILRPGTALRTIAGRFASLKNPSSLISNAGDPANAVNALRE